MKTRALKIASAVFVILVLLTLLAAILVPGIIRSKAVESLEKETGRKVSIGKISFNPFGLTATIHDFAMKEKTGGVLFSLKSLRISLDSLSLAKRALIIDEATLDSPVVNFSRIAPNRYSFSDIFDLQSQKPKSKEASRPHLFSVNNISITNGTIDFLDNVLNTEKKHTVRSIELSIPFISNIPHLLERYTDPKLSMIVNGSPLSFSGKTKPLSRSMETSLHFRLNRFNLAHYASYIPATLPADLDSGILDLEIDVNYRVSSDKKPILRLRGNIGIDDVSVSKSKVKIAGFKSLKIATGDIDLMSQKFPLLSLELDQPEVNISRDSQGILNLANTGTGKKNESGNKASTPAPVVKREVSIDSVKISGGTVNIQDNVPKPLFRSSITDLELAATGISLAEGKKSLWKSSFRLAKETSFSADGSLSLTPLALETDVAIRSFDIGMLQPYLKSVLSVPVTGRVDCSAHASFDPLSGFALREGTISLKDINTSFAEKDGIRIKQSSASGISFSQKDQMLAVGDVRVSGGDIRVSKEPDGSISTASMFSKPASGVSASTPDPVTTSRAVAVKTQSGSNFNYAFRKISLDRIDLQLTDKSIKERPVFSLKNSSISLNKLNGPKPSASTFSFSSTFNKATPIKLSGSLTPAPFSYKGMVSVGRLQLRDFEDYFPANLNVFLIGGTLDTNLDIDAGIKDGKLYGSYRGNLGIRAFHTIDTIAEEDLLKWESLQLDDISGTLSPVSLSIKQVALNNVYSRIIIRKDGTLNLQNLMSSGTRTDPSEASAKAERQHQSQSAETNNKADHTGSGKRPADIRIADLTIQEGTLAFSDYHLPQTFTTTFFNLGGRVSGLSSENTTKADVDLRGNLENHSPLRITGTVNPLKDDLFVDLKVSFRDIDLSPATPYSGTYLGYEIAQGKLFLDLRYLIDKKRLDSENRIFIDQFTFGNKVDSSKATSLPVKLGIALLKDRKGEIHLDVPVTGQTDDPKFSIWGIVFKVVKNLLVKAVTSPFSLISSMFGSGEDLSYITFAPGKSAIEGNDGKKLDSLAKALAERPSLRVDISSYVDREKDTEGYRHELLNRKIRNEKFIALAKQKETKEGDTAESVVVNPDEYSRYLKSVYIKEKFPKPRNMLGMLKDIPDEEMKKLIIANTVVGDEQLMALAKERTNGVANYLVSKGSIPSERIFRKNDDIHKNPEKEGMQKGRSHLSINVK